MLGYISLRPSLDGGGMERGMDYPKPIPRMKRNIKIARRTKKRRAPGFEVSE
jgi:hypothetical protein